jgi:CheY-like chemotaxis protein
MKIHPQGFSILYVDDEGHARELMAKILRQKGLFVHTAGDGREGWNLFKLHAPDIIVTDISMPIMNGIEMSREIRKICSKTPIIIASAYLHMQCLLEFEKIGIHSYIQKPIELEMLFSSIASCCEDIRNFPGSKIS